MGALCALLGCAQGTRAQIAADNPTKVRTRTYLSDQDPNYALLELHQRIAYEQEELRLPIYEEQVSKFTTEAFQRDIYNKIGRFAGVSFEQYYASAKELMEDVLKQQPPTRYEHPASYMMVYTLALPVRGAVKKLGLPTPELAFGTTPAWAVSAQTAHGANGERAILVNTGLFETTSRFCKAFAAFDPASQAKEGPTLEFAVHLGEVYAWHVGWADGEEFDVNSAQLLFQAACANVMSLFAVAHEYAHAVLNHRPYEGNSDGLRVLSGWSQEFAADRIALLATSQVMADGARLLSVSQATALGMNYMVALSIDMLMVLLDHIDRSHRVANSGAEVSLLTEGERRMFDAYTKCSAMALQLPSCASGLDKMAEGVTSHPPASFRIQVLRETSAKALPMPAESRQRVRDTVEMLDMMWRNTVLPQLVIMYNRRQLLVQRNTSVDLARLHSALSNILLPDEVDFRYLRRASVELIERLPGHGFTRATPNLYVRQIRSGQGRVVQATDTVMVECESHFADGTGFSSSYPSGQPLDVVVTDENVCWSQALLGMAEGSSARSVCTLDRIGNAPLGASGPWALVTDFTIVRVRRPEDEIVNASQFISNEAQKPGASHLPDGPVIIILEAGDGPSVGQADTVRLHYELRNSDEHLIDSTFKRGRPAEVNLAESIPCLRSGLTVLRVGTKARIACPPDTAFGDQGRPPIIRMGQAVSFLVDVVRIQ